MTRLELAVGSVPPAGAAGGFQGPEKVNSLVGSRRYAPCFFGFADHPDEVSMRQAGIDAIHYALEQLPYGSDNVYNRSWAAPYLVKQVRADQDGFFKFSCTAGVPGLRVVAQTARAHGAGNCGEMATLVFLYLHDRGIRPIDYATLMPPPRTAAKAYRPGASSPYSTDHAFVLLGRPGNSWYQGWVVDAHLSHLPVPQRVYPISEMPTRMRHVREIFLQSLVRAG